jgi:hypothetical protein
MTAESSLLAFAIAVDAWASCIFVRDCFSCMN